MNLQQVLRSVTRSLMLNTGRQIRDPDSYLNNTTNSALFADECSTEDEQHQHHNDNHLLVTFACARSGRRRRVCATVGETVAELAKRYDISLDGVDRVEAHRLCSLRPIYVDNPFYSNLRGPSRKGAVRDEFFDTPIPLAGDTLEEIVLTHAHDGLQITLI